MPSTSKIDSYLELSRAAHWFSNNGPCCRLLRDRLAELVGAYCVPVASGTLGLMAAIASLGRRGQGSRAAGALMPSFTFPATAQAAIWAGHTPHLLDIDPAHWHLDAARLELVLREEHRDTSVVIAVGAFGTPPPAETRERWEQACRVAGVPLIVDSAAGFGGVGDDGLPIGVQGDVEIVSFHATKPFAVGEGGAVFTTDRAVHERIERTVNFGLGADREPTTAMGLNAKMSEFHAAVALAVLDDYHLILERRRRMAQQIRAEADPSIAWQAGCERSTWQFVPVAFPDAERRLRAETACDGVMETRKYYEPLHTLKPFSDCPVRGGGLECTTDLRDRVLCLPMANDLSADEISAITSVVRTEREADARVGAGTRSAGLLR
jgi:dTDP-4-amino-4,6-dideoxygalactose transaminase